LLLGIGDVLQLDRPLSFSGRLIAIRIIPLFSLLLTLVQGC
jgi:hypothetical protein